MIYFIFIKEESVLEFITKFFTECWIYLLISSIAAYLISSVNTSIIVTAVVKHEDIRKMGSGNAGFTNVLRCVGKVPAIITFVGDFLKGVISVLIPILLTISWSTPEQLMHRQLLMYIAGIFAVVGHMFPIYYRFKGGKGVVTTASVIIMTDWRVLILELIVFAIFFVITKTISKCSLLCAGLYPFLTALTRYLDSLKKFPTLAPVPETTPEFILCCFVLTFLIGIAIIIMHRENIKRILNGTEQKITSKKSDK